MAWASTCACEVEQRRHEMAKSKNKYTTDDVTDTRRRGAMDAEDEDRTGSRLVTGLYRSPTDAERAFGDLTTRHGYEPQHVSVLMSDETRKKYWNSDLYHKHGGSKTLEGMGVGGAVGGTLGAIV